MYITAAARNDAIVEHIVEVHKTRQPVLVGTRDVAESEDLHERLVKAGVPAVVLNAKNDAEEAAVIAEAGALGSVTVSTQMAGRGTDIRLGGSDEADHDEVAELGGLHVIGTGRHTTERLDNQLRGRAGTPGRSGIVGVLRQLGGRRRSRPPGVRASCRCRPTTTAASSIPRRPACSTTRSASPRGACSTCTPTRGATTN